MVREQLIHNLHRSEFVELTTELQTSGAGTQVSAFGGYIQTHFWDSILYSLYLKYTISSFI